MADYLSYRVRVSTLTPLHIGNGRSLLHQYDYAIYQKQTWRIDENALLDAQDVEDVRMADVLARTPPAQLLRPGDYDPTSPFFRYVIKGTPRSQAEGAQLNEQLKDAFDRPYLPGSSLKGALRTGIGWFAWKELGVKAEAQRLNRRKQWAAQAYEQQIFGPTPNRDLLRALHVSDSQPLSPEKLLIANVSVLSRRGEIKAPIEMEAIVPDTTFELSLKIDLMLFSEWAQKSGLKLGNPDWLRQLSLLMQSHAQDRIKRELAWFEQIESASRISGFYQQLANATLGPNRFLMQLGWGTGWEDKTFGSRLRGDDAFMERIINDYRMTIGRRQTGTPFPASRRVAIGTLTTKDGRRVETPLSALGWCLVEMEDNK